MGNKRRGSTRRGKKNYNRGIPNGIQRLDKELMSEIKMYYSITNSIEATAKAYRVSKQMVEYACRMGKDFDSLQNEISKEDDK